MQAVISQPTWLAKDRPDTFYAQAHGVEGSHLRDTGELLSFRPLQMRTPLRLFLRVAGSHDDLIQLTIVLKDELPREWSSMALEACECGR